MAKATSEERLADYERRYREFAAQLAEIGLISSGSVRRPCTRSRDAGLQASRQSAATARALLPVDSRGRRQDRHATAQWPRSAAVSGSGPPTTGGCAVSSPRCVRWRRRLAS